jgi:hypothetical protein
VAPVALGERGGELGLGRGAGDERVDDVTAVLEDRPRDAGRRRRHLPRVVGLGGGAADGGYAGLGVDEVVQSRHQRLLGADAVVHGLGGRLGDVAHARAGVPALGEQPSRGSEDRVPRELRPPFSQARGVLRHGLGTPDLTSVPVGGRAGGRLGLGAPRWVVEHRSAGGGLTVAALGCFVGCDGFLEHDDGCPPDR